MWAFLLSYQSLSKELESLFHVALSVFSYLSSVDYFTSKLIDMRLVFTWTIIFYYRHYFLNSWLYNCFGAAYGLISKGISSHQNLILRKNKG